MRLREIEVENYGIFSGRKFSFGDGQFEVVCGPNEAGKTTLLELIRELLFGFAHSNPYSFPTHVGEMAATARLEMADGRRLRFRRRKGRNQPVQGEFEAGGTSIDEAGLADLLGSATAELFRHVFAFSLKELAEGEESLKKARLEDALYGGGIGGLANFQKARSAIEDEAAELFLPSKRASRRINRLADELHGVSTKLKEAMLRPAEYKELCDAREQALQAEQACRQQQEETALRLATLKRQSTALPAWQALQLATRELHEIQVPETFPPDGGQEYRDLLKECQSVARSLAEDEAAIGRANEELSALRRDPPLLEQAGEIKRLLEDVGAIRQCRKDILTCEGQRATILEAVARELRQIDPEWGLGELERFRTSLAARHCIEQIAEELRGLEAEAKTLAEGRQEKARQLAEGRRERDWLAQVVAVPQLEQLCRRGGQFLAEQEQLAQQAADLEALDRQLTQSGRRLAEPFGLPTETLATLAVPFEAAVQEFGQRLKEHATDQRGLARSCSELRRDLNQRRERLAQQARGQAIPDRQQLLDRRARRDAGWQLIRDRHIDNRPRPEEEATWLAEGTGDLAGQYEVEVGRADELADQRQEKAEAVAQQETMQAEIAAAEARLAEAEKECAEGDESGKRLQAEWANLWKRAGVAPQGPEVMLPWLQSHANFCELVVRRGETESRRRRLEERLAAFVTELRGALDDNACPPAGLLEQAQTRVDEARDAVLQCQRIERTLPGMEEELTRLDAGLAANARRKEDCGGRWRAMLGELGFPATWDAELARRIVAALAEVTRQYDQVPTLETRLEQMREAVTAFEQASRSLCQAVAGDLGGLPAEEAISQANERLNEARQAEKDYRRLSGERDRAARHREEMLRRQKESAARLEELRAAARASSDTEFLSMAEAAGRKRKLEEEIAGRRREIQAAAGGRELATFEAELSAADPDMLAAQEAQAQSAHDAAVVAYRAAVECAARATVKLDELDSRTPTAELVQQQESYRAELRAAVDRYAPLVIAQALMDEAIGRFQREHQPAMMREVGELFSRMTLGRYVGLQRRLDEQGTLLVELADGDTRQPSQLSTGTREQLYLSIRLAYARHYCRSNEPLPLVIDDVLVNFDDRRAAGALDALIETSQQIQVILLTCHPSTLERVRAKLPNLVPVEL